MKFSQNKEINLDPTIINENTTYRKIVEIPELRFKCTLIFMLIALYSKHDIVHQYLFDFQVIRVMHIEIFILYIPKVLLY